MPEKTKIMGDDKPEEAPIVVSGVNYREYVIALEEAIDEVKIATHGHNLPWKPVDDALSALKGQQAA